MKTSYYKTELIIGYWTFIMSKFRVSWNESPTQCFRTTELELHQLRMAMKFYYLRVGPNLTNPRYLL